MALVTIVRFSVLGEAQVARTALHSAGIPAVVAEEYYGSTDWLLQVALQGFRLMVPVEAFNDAAQVLAEARRLGAEDMEREPSDLVIPPRPPEWVVLGLLPGLAVPEVGFLVEAARRKPTPGRLAFLWIFYGLFALWLLAALSTCARG